MAYLAGHRDGCGRWLARHLRRASAVVFERALRPVLVLLLMLQLNSPALASLDAPEPVVLLWSLPTGFVCGLLSLLVRPSKRWIFVALPALACALAAAGKLLLEGSGPALASAALLLLLTFGVLLLQVGAGFLLAMLLGLLLRAILRR